MIRKNFKKLLSISLATGILIGGASASAEVIGYVTESEGVRYEYSQEDLIESIINKTALYERYRTEKLVALVDDKNGYIDAEDVIGAIIQASMNKERLNVNDYTESEVAKVIELEGVKRLDSNGQVLAGDQVDDGEDSEPEDEIKEYTDAKYFDFDSSKGEITGYSEEGPRDVVIPNEIDGVTVTTIGEWSFAENNLTSIEIPSSVTRIEEWAFGGNNLTSIKIPNSVTSIGPAAFGFNRLTNVEIPDSVNAIGDFAFQFNNLTSFELPNSITSIGVYLFIDNNLTSIVIPDSVTSIEYGAFAGNRLESVVIPDSVTTIGSEAFGGNNLESVEIPNSVTSIGEAAFDGNNLESVEIPNSVTSIGKWAFSGNKLKSVVISDSVTYIGNKAFSNNDLGEEDVKLGSGHPNFWLYDGDDSNKLIGHILGGDNGVLIIPEGVTSIREGAFADNDLESVEIPNSVTSIGSHAFWYNNLSSLEIPNSVTSIGDWAFYENNLNSVEIPNSVTSIGVNAFLMNNLTSVRVPSHTSLSDRGSFDDNVEIIRY